MKKLLLSFIMFIATVLYVNAQSFQLSWNDEILGDTVTFHGSADTLMVFNPIFTNLLGVDANVSVVKNDVSIVDGAENTICWGACFPPGVDSTGVTLVAAGASTDRDYFLGDYNALGHPGTSIIWYKFYNVDNEDQYLEVVVKFVAAPNAIDENMLSGIKFSDIYPNPANDFVTLDYKLVPGVKGGSVRISNLLGAVVSETAIDLNSNSVRMDVSNLEGGIYFYSVVLNGEILHSKKLIIR